MILRKISPLGRFRKYTQVIFGEQTNNRYDFKWLENKPDK